MTGQLVIRDYQANDIGRLRASYASGHRAPLYQLPTCGGKTPVVAAIAASARGKGRRVLIAAHRRELLQQP